MKYFIADLHFGHENIINFSKRPYKNALEMDEDMIKIWNKTIKPTDEVYIVGDLTMSNKEEVLAGYISRLNGRKHLIVGNHDYFANKSWANKYFESMTYYMEMKYNGVKFAICHYPFNEWNGSVNGSIHIHGHIHNNPYVGVKPQGNIFNVGIDIIGKPISIEDVIKYFRDGGK